MPQPDPTDPDRAIEPPPQHVGASQGTGGRGGGGGSSRDEESMLAGWYRMGGGGSEFVVAVGLFAAIGYGLDRWLGSRPWLMLVGMGLGFAVGLWSMVKLARKSFK